MATADVLLTAEEFSKLPDDGVPCELVQGRIVRMNMPFARHSEICATIVLIVATYVRDHGLGRVMSNDGGIVTERDPDTVRGADVAFYSYARMPKGPAPHSYPAVVPELVFEVRSASDRWRDIHAKAFEYIDAGVAVVCVVDPMAQTVHVYSAEQPIRTVTVDEELSLPEVLGDFRVKVERLFE